MRHIAPIDRENLEKSKQTTDLLLQDLKALLKTQDEQLLREVQKIYDSSNQIGKQLEEISQVVN